MQEITLETKIADLLSYEGMKDILIEINPKFEKLNNPILRRTIAKVAGVKQAAIVGGMDPMVLLNKLRVAVGQAPLEETLPSTETTPQAEPTWINQEASIIFDANEVLDNDKNPLAELNKALKSLDKGEVIVIHSDFRPEPLIEEFIKKGHEVYAKEVNPNAFVTYILR